MNCVTTSLHDLPIVLFFGGGGGVLARMPCKSSNFSNFFLRNLELAEEKKGSSKFLLPHRSIMQNVLRQAAVKSVRQTRCYSRAGAPDYTKLAQMAEKNGNLFKREAAIAIGVGILGGIAWKLSIADPVRRGIDNYYAEYNKRNGL